MCLRLSLKLANLLLLAFLMSCSVVQKVAVGTTGQIAGQASYEMEQERDWEVFYQATPGNLKFIEGLLYLEPKNEELLLASLKARAGYGFGVYETLWLDERLSAREDEIVKNSLNMNYSKAIEYGLRLLELKGVELKVLQTKLQDNKLNDYLNKNLDKNDLELVFYTAQSMGSLVNYNRSRPILVSRLPLVKGLFDWVCEKDPNFNHGACEIFYGAYEAGRPKMLGGNLEKGRAHFLKAIEKFPYNRLARVSYMIHYVIPTFDNKEFVNQKDILEESFEELDELYIWNPDSNRLGEELKKAALFNAIAKKQFEIIVANEDEIF